MTALPIFSDDETCPKCGTMGPALKYRPAVVAEAGPWITKETAPLLKSTPEHLECTCWRCGFSWERLPKDTPDPSLALPKDLTK